MRDGKILKDNTLDRKTKGTWEDTVLSFVEPANRGEFPSDFRKTWSFEPDRKSNKKKTADHRLFLTGVLPEVDACIESFVSENKAELVK